MMFRDHRQVFPVVIVTVVRRCRSVAPSPEYTVSGDYRSSAPGGSAKGPSSRLLLPSTSDLMQFRPESARRWGSLGSFPKRVGFRHGTDSILHCRPQVSSQKMDTCRGVERFSSITKRFSDDPQIQTPRTSPDAETPKVYSLPSLRTEMPNTLGVYNSTKGQDRFQPSISEFESQRESGSRLHSVCHPDVIY